MAQQDGGDVSIGPDENAQPATPGDIEHGAFPTGADTDPEPRTFECEASDGARRILKKPTKGLAPRRT